MKSVCWFLLALSVAAFLIGAFTRFTSSRLVAGVDPGTFWKAAMAFLAYAVALRILGEEKRPV
jgi:hypothetical protein